MQLKTLFAAALTIALPWQASQAAPPAAAASPAATISAATPPAAASPAVAAPAPPPVQAEATPDSIIVYFGTGSAAVRAADMAQLDHAARLFRDAKPIVMQVAGSADTVGSAEANLRLSQLRADAVFRGLVERGIPASRFQIVAKGATEPNVQTGDGVAEERNRRVQITWR